MKSGQYVIRLAGENSRARADITDFLRSQNILATDWVGQNLPLDRKVTFSRLTISSDQVCATLRKAIQDISLTHSVSAALLPELVANAPKRLYVFDMDSTFIQQEVIDEIADFAGLKQQVSEITEKAMRGELDFKEALAERVALLRGIPEEKLEEVKPRLTLQPGVAEAVSYLLQQVQAYVYLISGGFINFTGHFAKSLNLTGYFANTLETTNGVLTGKTVGEIIDKHAKESKLNHLLHTYRINPDNVVAIGDGANDALMLQAAGTGVAFCAKRNLQDQCFAFIQKPDMRDLVALAEPLKPEA